MGKKKRKKAKVKVENYTNNGIFELARFGNVVSLRNVSSPEQHAKIVEYFKNEYPEVKERIDRKVINIRDKIACCNPWMLLKFMRDMSMLAQMNKFSESEYTTDENTLIRGIDYIQSILVSTVNRYNSDESEEQQEKRFYSILADIEDLFKEFVHFYSYWAAYIESTHEVSNDVTDYMDYIIESQMLYLVRGNRYQIFQLEPLKQLLPPHSDILKELFGVTSGQIIEGLTKLEYAMSQGIGDAWMAMEQKYEEYCKSVSEGGDSEAAIENNCDALNPIFNQIFGDGLNNILNITGWDERLINALALSVGECDTFFTGKEFSGWPIMEMPTKRKPFIKIDGIVYGFDYYSLFDNFYRALYKEIIHLRPEYKITWNHRQNIASENMVKSLFLKLLPGATAYNGNYYPVNNSTKQMYENDLIITYENFLFIIEVKAGSFPLTPPITDFNAHIQAYKELAQEADTQCSRTLNYLETHEIARFYRENKQEKFIINTKTFDEIFSFSVTVDNFNAFAAKAEKLNFITLKSKTIVISYDDLLSYENYFDSSIYFLHYLKQRKHAIDIPQISVHDELDHLGMYIEHNIYSITASEFPPEAHTYFGGYREKLDNYFCRLYHPSVSIPKPTQDIPKEITDIIAFIEKRISKSSISFAHFLLDMSSEAKEEFCQAIATAFSRQVELGRNIVMFAAGGFKYCLFVDIPGIKIMSSTDRKDYVLSAVLRDKSMPIMWINLKYDNRKNLIDAEAAQYCYEDIPEKDIMRLSILSDEYAKSRIEHFQRQNHKKIGRNDPCPCGSGKKYKNCCLHSLDL